MTSGMVQGDDRTVAGIDIGGDRKGCHLVILSGTSIVTNINSKSPEDMLRQCVDNDVQAVGIDAPCFWSNDGKARAAERALAKDDIFCFSTPTREKATSNASGFYNWMLNGEKVFQAFASVYPLLTSRDQHDGKVSFETFPHAITCSVRGRKNTSAKRKRVERRGLLSIVGINLATLKSIDAVDAALCAWTAACLLDDSTTFYGESESGYIVVPKLAMK